MINVDEAFFALPVGFFRHRTRKGNGRACAVEVSLTSWKGNSVCVWYLAASHEFSACQIQGRRARHQFTVLKMPDRGVVFSSPWSDGSISVVPWFVLCCELHAPFIQSRTKCVILLSRGLRNCSKIWYFFPAWANSELVQLRSLVVPATGVKSAISGQAWGPSKMVSNFRTVNCKNPRQIRYIRTRNVPESLPYLRGFFACDICSLFMKNLTKKRHESCYVSQSWLYGESEKQTDTFGSGRQESSSFSRRF